MTKKKSIWDDDYNCMEDDEYEEKMTDRFYPSQNQNYSPYDEEKDALKGFGMIAVLIAGVVITVLVAVTMLTA